jgi:predicted secreted protein
LTDCQAIAEATLSDDSSCIHSREVQHNIEERSMILNERDSGRTIVTAPGKVINVFFKENPTTGYRWTVEADSGMEEIGNHFKAGKAIGGEGIQEFQFRTGNPGSYELRMKKWREWEGEDSVIDRFTVKIIVKRSS